MSLALPSHQPRPEREPAIPLALAAPRGWRRLFAPFTHRISGKIIGPYLVLVVVLAVFATYVVMNLVTTSLEEKFRSQLADSGRLANESIVDLEGDHLRAIRQMAFTQGAAELVAGRRSQELLELYAPIAANLGVGYVDVLDLQGRQVLAIRPPDRGTDLAHLVDPAAAQWPPVQPVLAGQVDSLGDKFSAIVQTSWGPMLYTVGPVKDGTTLVGAIAVGAPLEKVIARLSQDAVAGITFYGPDGAALGSSVAGAAAALRVDPADYQRLFTSEDQVLQRTISLRSSRYYEILGVLEVRQRPALLMGVSQSVSLIMDKGAETRNFLMVLFGTVIALVLVAGLLLARALLRPIRLLVAACRAMAHGDFSHEVPVISRDETGVLTVSFNESLKGLRERDRARDAFGRYMSPELYEAIQRGELKLGGETREITTILSDIRSFTTLSEGMEPEDLVLLLNRYFETQVAAIQRYGGTVDKFMGDAILAKFGAPAWYPDHARRAALAMLDMRQALVELNAELAAQGLAPLRIGVGANTGAAVVGNIGSTSRMEYTIIGDTVNATQRIEDLCKELKWDLLIGDTTYAEVADLIEVGEPHRVVLRGRQQETLIYPVLGLRPGMARVAASLMVTSAQSTHLSFAASGEGERHV